MSSKSTLEKIIFQQLTKELHLLLQFAAPFPLPFKPLGFNSG